MRRSSDLIGTYVLHGQIESDAGGAVIAVLEVAEEADGEVEGGHHEHGRVEYSIDGCEELFGVHAVVDGQHAADSLEGVHGRAEEDGPVVDGRRQNQLLVGLQVAVQEQVVQDDADRADHDEVGEGAEWRQVLEVADQAVQNHGHQDERHDALSAQTRVRLVVLNHLLDVRRDEDEVDGAEA